MPDIQPPAVDVRRHDITSPVAASLILALNAELSAIYPEAGACHFRLDAGEVTEGCGAFLVAFQGDQPVGCGAIRRLDAETAEFKRMYVTPANRRKGIGAAIVKELEAEGQHLGIRRIVLETGIRNPDALALYAKAGFVRIPAFGEYVNSPLSVCMAKTLNAGRPDPKSPKV
jgi:putative acetyltransferase